MKTNNLETHTVPELAAPMRLQEYGVGIFKSLPTKSALKKALKKKRILVAGKIGTTATFIHGREHISLESEVKPLVNKSLNLPLTLLYEDPYVAAIEKIAGIEVSGNSFKTIAAALPQNLTKEVFLDACTPQPVHRLDYVTTGVLLVGKTNTSIRLLNKLFEEKKISKTYIAIAIGNMNPHGVMNTAVNNKVSQANYTVLQTVPSKRFGQLNLLKLHPKTGRRHQLRIQLAAMGNPILGDQAYGVDPYILKGKGLFLHAHSLAFIHPVNQENMYLESEIPKRFLNIFPSMKSLL